MLKKNNNMLNFIDNVSFNTVYPTYSHYRYTHANNLIHLLQLYFMPNLNRHLVPKLISRLPEGAWIEGSGPRSYSRCFTLKKKFDSNLKERRNKQI